MKHSHRLLYSCNECDSEFVLHYTEEECESDPTYCPFCGSYILIDESEQPIEDDY